MHKKILHSFLFALLILVISAFSHKFYVSLVQVEFNQETEALEITMKIFTDDLEYAISGSQISYGLGTENEPSEADTILYDYIRKNFSIAINGQSYTPNYIGKEVEMDVTWIYTEILGIESIRTVEVSNLMLTELFDDQVNLVNVKYLEQKKGMLLNRNNRSGTIKLNH